MKIKTSSIKSLSQIYNRKSISLLTYDECHYALGRMLDDGSLFNDEKNNSH